MTNTKKKPLIPEEIAVFLNIKNGWLIAQLFYNDKYNYWVSKIFPNKILI
jgi:hypothetical protein